MLDRIDALQLLYSKRVTPNEFNWDRLWAPSIYNFMAEYHIDKLYNIATSIRYAGDPDKKDNAIRDLLHPLGFRRFAAGTNRIVYSYLEDTTFLIKVAIDRVGLDNSPDEFRNQMYLKPFISKCFEVHPSGVVASFERGMPITNLQEFLSIWDDVFEAILHMTGERVIEDIGANFFMNWCIRKNFGPILCDYPEVFELDGNKIFCNRPIIPGTKFPVCGTPIDYDDGFNFLVCPKCGKTYRARELAAAVKSHDIIMKGEFDMDVMVVRGDEVLVDGREIVGTDTIMKPEPKKIKKPKRTELGVSIVRGDEVLFNDKKEIKWDKLTEPVYIGSPTMPTQQQPMPSMTKYTGQQVDVNFTANSSVFMNNPALDSITTASFQTIKSIREKQYDPEKEDVVVQEENVSADNSSTEGENVVVREENASVDDNTEDYVKALEITTREAVNIPEVFRGTIDDLIGDTLDTTYESSQEEEIGWIPPDEIENPEWNKVDPDAPEPVDPDYNNVNYDPSKEAEEPKVEETPKDKEEPPKEKEQTEEDPISEMGDSNDIEPTSVVREESATMEEQTTTVKRKEYGDKEPIGSSVMADALKGFHMDTPMHDTTLPEFRKKPEVPDGLESF